jgi:CheY-like chemotaxis protein
MVRENQAIDLLVTDIIMPGRMNGIELAQKVRELCPGIHVIFTSGFPADALAERSGGKVEGPLLRKPYLRAEFMELVAKSMTRNTPYDEETSRPGEQRAGTGTSI